MADLVPLSAFHDGPANDYELAMLTDGPDLVVLVALLNLESRGALKLARRESRLTGPGARAQPTPSIVASIGSLEPPADPVETAVYRAVRGTRPRRRLVPSQALRRRSTTSATVW